MIAWIQTTSTNATCNFMVHAYHNCLLYTLTVLFTQTTKFFISESQRSPLLGQTTLRIGMIHDYTFQSHSFNFRFKFLVE